MCKVGLRPALGPNQTQKYKFSLNDCKIRIQEYIWNCLHHSISGSWNCQCHLMIQMVGIGHITGIPVLTVKIIIVSIACWIWNPSVLGVPYSKMNSGFAQSGQIFLIFQSSNWFHIFKSDSSQNSLYWSIDINNLGISSTFLIIWTILI